MTINIDDYGKFVRSTTSDESLRTEVMADRLFGLQNTYKDAEWSQLITCSMGMQAESGEFSEIIKKIVFQGKHFDEDVKFHLKRELGDVLWYWVMCAYKRYFHIVVCLFASFRSTHNCLFNSFANLW